MRVFQPQGVDCFDYFFGMPTGTDLSKKLLSIGEIFSVSPGNAATIRIIELNILTSFSMSFSLFQQKLCHLFPTLHFPFKCFRFLLIDIALHIQWGVYPYNSAFIYSLMYFQLSIVSKMAMFSDFVLLFIFNRISKLFLLEFCGFQCVGNTKRVINLRSVEIPLSWLEKSLKMLGGLFIMINTLSYEVIEPKLVPRQCIARIVPVPPVQLFVEEGCFNRKFFNLLKFFLAWLV